MVFRSVEEPLISLRCDIQVVTNTVEDTQCEAVRKAISERYARAQGQVTLAWLAIACEKPLLRHIRC